MPASRSRKDSRRVGVNERARLLSRLQDLVDWHERRAKVKRINAGQEPDPTSRATLLGNADAHDVAAAVLGRVLEGKPVEQ